MIPGDAGPADCIVNAIKFLPSGLSSSGVVGCGCGEGCGSNIVILELKSYQNIKTNKRALGTLFPWVCGLWVGGCDKPPKSKFSIWTLKIVLSDQK